MQSETINPWDQLTTDEPCLTCGNYCSEGALAFGLFLIYRNMPPQDRSRRRVIAETIANCAECKSGEQSSSIQSISRHTCRGEKIIHKVANKYHWTARTRAFDRSMAKAEESAVIKSLQKTAMKRAQEWSTFSDRVWDLSTRLLDKVSAILDLPITEQQITEMAGETFVDFETGQQRSEKIINITIKPVKTSPKDASAMLRDADTLARLAVGKETSIFGFDINGIEQAAEKLARAAYVKLQDEYADNPAMLELLPSLVSERFNIDQKLLIQARPESVVAEQQDNEFSN